MKICQAGVEMVPYAKTGGLADVLGALPAQLVKREHEVVSIIPLYRDIDRSLFTEENVIDGLTIPVGDGRIGCAVHFREEESGARTYFLEHEDFFNREGIYGEGGRDYVDNAVRFIFYSRAVLEVLRALDFAPDIIQCHDWQTGLIPAYLKTSLVLDPFFAKTACVFTIHNGAYQGTFPAGDMHLTGIDYSHFNHMGLEYKGELCLLKAGIVYADMLTTVSKRYAQEIQSPEFGMGLESLYRQRRTELIGILNGVDYDIWDPGKDPYLVNNFTADEINGKAVCKHDLQKSFELPEEQHAPIVAMITRLVWQKGFDIVDQVLEALVTQHGLQMIFLGSGESRYESRLWDMRHKYPHRVGVRIDFDEELAHKIEAGADFLLMPSRYEPCGLNQIYSLRYGTLPIVRATGGLDDSIRNFEPENNSGNGFKFYDLNPSALYQTTMWALDVYWRFPEHYQQLQKRAMAERFTWERAVDEYLAVYRKALRKRIR